jgi:hypothetical protein
MSADALIGYTGYVGGTLLAQRPFGALYRSTNIGEIAGRSFDLVVCAGAPAQKWIANREPAADRARLEELMRHLASMECRTMVLISTVDVFADSTGADERTAIAEDGLGPYGLHRRLLEKFVEQRFPRHLIVRLPGLVGPGLRKNAVYDFKHDNNLHAIDSRAVYQFYPMTNLWSDIQVALRAGLRLVHLTAEPLSIAEVASEAFDRRFDQQLPATPARYDMRSVHAGLFGGAGSYQYSKQASIQAIRAYAQAA